MKRISSKAVWLFLTVVCIAVFVAIPLAAVSAAVPATTGVNAATPSGPPVGYLAYSLEAYREASYGTPPNGLGTPDDYTGSMAGCHLKIVVTFPGAVTITDAAALGSSFIWTPYAGVVFASTSSPFYQTSGPDPALTTYTPSGDTLTIDTKILYLPGGVLTITANPATTTNGILNGISVQPIMKGLPFLSSLVTAKVPVHWTGIYTVVPTGLTTKTISVTVGTAATPASTTIRVTHSANVRSMNHIIWLSNGASILSGTVTSQSTPAHHHMYWLFTTSGTTSANGSAASIVGNAASKLNTAGYTVTQSADTVIITAKTNSVGQILDIESFDDNFLQANGLNLANHVSGLTYPTIGAIADQTYTGSALTPSITVMGRSYNKWTFPAATYKNNVAVGTATVSVIIGGCTYVAPFVIRPISI